MADTLKMISGLSPSSLELWQQCPRRFYLEKFEKRPTSAGIDALKGTFVHLVLEHVCQLPPTERTVEAARTLARSLWPTFAAEREWTEFVADTQFVEDTRFRRKAWESVVGYFEVEDPRKVEVVATERRIEATIRGVPIVGIIDRLERDVFDDLITVDYKAGKVTEKWFEAPKIRQLNTYGALVEAADGERPSGGKIVYTTFQVIREFNFTEESLDDCLSQYEVAWAEIGEAFETRDDAAFAPTPGALCSWCPHVADCDPGIEAVIRRSKETDRKTGEPKSIGEHGQAVLDAQG